MAELAQIASALRDLGIEFPETATLSQLKRLLSLSVGALRQENGAPDNENCSSENATLASSASNGSSENAISTSNAGSGGNKDATSTSNVGDGSGDNAILASNIGSGTLASTESVGTVPPIREHSQCATSALGTQLATTSALSGPRVTSEINKTSVAAFADSELDDVEARLEKRLRILHLQAEIERLEIGKAPPRFPVNFSDIERAITNFSGDDKLDIVRWVRDFDSITNAYGCDEESKLLIARRLLTGSAQILLRMMNFNKWCELKEHLIKEFKKPVSVKDIFQELQNRVWKRSESVMHYVLSMQELAQSAPIEEIELVEFIIDGLGDKTSNTLIFSGVTTVECLKKLLPQYEKLVSKAAPTKYNNKSPMHRSQESTMRCYNCSSFGHFAKDCAKQKRSPGSCFKCGKQDHQYKNCPMRAVAALEEAGENLDKVYYREVPK